MGVLNVIFTIDTEHGSGGKPYRINGDLSEFGLKENFGISSIMDIFEKHKMKAVFFVNVYESKCFDPPYENCIDESLKVIYNRGHEIGLHWHGTSTNKPLFASNAISLLSLEEQTNMIKRGLDYIQNVIGERPISYRSGAYRINNSTITALKRCGLRYDSSYWYGCPNNIVDIYHSINKTCFIDGVYEYPIISVIDNNGNITKLDLDTLSNEEIVSALYNIKEKNYSSVQIMFHSYSFLRKSTNNDDMMFSCGKNVYSGGDRDKKSKLDYLLSYLSLSPDFNVCLFKDIKDIEHDYSKIKDGFINTGTNRSSEMAKKLDEINFKNGKTLLAENAVLKIQPHKYRISYNKSDKTLNFIIEDYNKNNQYAFYLIDDGNTPVEKIYYKKSDRCIFKINKNGKYRIKYYIDDGTVRKSYYSKSISIEA